MVVAGGVPSISQGVGSLKTGREKEYRDHGEKRFHVSPEKKATIAPRKPPMDSVFSRPFSSHTAQNGTRRAVFLLKQKNGTNPSYLAPHI
jgi:hypothetical protein